MWVPRLHRRVRRRELRRRQRRRLRYRRGRTGRDRAAVLTGVAIVPAQRRRRPERKRRRESGNVAGLDRGLAGAVVGRVDGGIRTRVFAYLVNVIKLCSMLVTFRENYVEQWVETNPSNIRIFPSDIRFYASWYYANGFCGC
jgi:hypothetical protein